MTTETVQRMIHDDGHGQTTDSPSIHEKEKELVASVVTVSQHPLEPREVSEDPEKKGRGFSAKSLQVDDFELIRTLGTGMFIPGAASSIAFQTDPGSGTFARVWLARLKDDKHDNRVYALKVLRKADGKEFHSEVISIEARIDGMFSFLDSHQTQTS
jgi:cytochrome c